jgi:hypothetical protein
MSKAHAGFTSITLAAVLFVASVAAAQGTRGKAQDDRDMAELASYRLTVATLQKLVVATQVFGQAMENDPQFKRYTAAEKELKALRAKDEPSEADEKRIAALEQELENSKLTSTEHASGNDSLADMERSITSIPHMSEALAKAGLSPREYAKFSLAMLQAGMVAAMKKAGTIKTIPADSGVSQENVQFMIDHEKEIADLTRQMHTLGK